MRWLDAMTASALRNLLFTHPLSKKSKCRRAACSEFWPMLTWETNCFRDLRVFPCNWRRFVHYKFTEWQRPGFRCHMGLSLLNGWNSSRCDPGRILQVKITKTLFSFRLSWICVWSRGCSKQWDGNRKFKAQKDVVEKGSATKSQTLKKAYIQWRVGQCFQWKAPGQCSIKDWCSFGPVTSLLKQCRRSETKRTTVFSCTKFDGKQTDGEGKEKKNRRKLFSQKEWNPGRFSNSPKKKKKPSCSPACQNKYRTDAIL